MRFNTRLITAAAVVLTVGALPVMALEATVDAGKTGAPIHWYMYGQFTELLGNMFENGLWSEMVSDRKFFYPVKLGGQTPQGIQQTGLALRKGRSYTGRVVLAGWDRRPRQASTPVRLCVEHGRVERCRHG